MTEPSATAPAAPVPPQGAHVPPAVLPPPAGPHALSVGVGAFVLGAGLLLLVGRIGLGLTPEWLGPIVGVSALVGLGAGVLARHAARVAERRRQL